LNHRFDAFEAFASQHGTGHRRLAGRDDIAFQTLKVERAAEFLRGIEELWGSSPQLDRAPVHPQDLAIDVARVNPDRQRIEDCLVHLEEGFEESGRLDRNVELQQGHARLEWDTAAYQQVAPDRQQQKLTRRQLPGSSANGSRRQASKRAR
jgi:hypothetical protein